MSSEEGDDEVDGCFTDCTVPNLADIWPRCAYPVEELIRTERDYITKLGSLVNVSM